MLNHILLIYLSVLIPFMNSIEFTELTPSPCGDEHCLYCDYKHLRYCNDCQIAQTTTISGFKHCQTECYANQYGRYNNTSVEECMFCDRAYEGCNGPLQVVEEKIGCKRCKVGIYEGEMKKCLHSENSQTICSDNGHKNYYRDTSNSSEKLWTDSICRECHPTCSSCSSYTNDPTTCVCKLYKKTDGSTSECSNFCPSDYRKLQIEHEPYQTCIKCPEGYELNVITGKCDKEVSIWSWKNALYIIGIIVLSIISAIFALGLIIWFKNRFIKINKLHNNPNNNRHNQQYSEQIPLQSLRSFSDDESFPEYDGSMLYEALAEKIRCQARNPEDFLISELEIKIYHGLENRLGSGAFGNVYKGLFHGHEEVAVKVIKDPGAQMEAYKGEGKIIALHLQGHPHLHTLKGICPGRLTYLVSELRLGNLKNFLRKNEHVFENEPWYLSLYCEQIASGMSFLEDHNILHRDLAARNVLVKNLAHVEVSDFGLSRVIRPNHFDKDYATQFAWRWLSIEALETCNLAIENDIWSYGVTCWEVFTFGKCVPYDDIFIGEDQQDSKPTTSLTPKQLLKALTRGLRLTKPNSCDRETFYGISECWLQVPLSRPRFDKLKEFFEEKVSSLHPNEGTTTDIDYECPKPSTSKDTLMNKVYAPKPDSLTLEYDTQLPITYETEDSYGNKSTVTVTPSEFDGRDTDIELEETIDRRSIKCEQEELIRTSPRPISFKIDIVEEEFKRYVYDPDDKSPISITSIDSTISSGYGSGQDVVDIKDETIPKSNIAKVKENIPFLTDHVNKTRNNFLNVAKQFADVKLWNKVIFPDDPYSYPFNMHYFKEIETISNTKSSIKKFFHEPSKREVLIKFLPIPKRPRGKEKTCKMKNLIDEINALQKMNNSSHIVQIYGLCVLSEDHKYAQICMEPMDMSLEVMHRRFVEHFGFIPENLLVLIIVCLVDALKECHQNNVLQGDLHQSNILLNYTGDVKLCDFKVSTILTGNETDESKAMSRYIDNLADMLLELIDEQGAKNLSWKRRNKVEPRSVSEGKFQSGNPQESSIIKEFINACYGSTKNYQSLMETGLYVNYCKISTPNDIEKILDEYKFCFAD